MEKKKRLIIILSAVLVAVILLSVLAAFNIHNIYRWASDLGWGRDPYSLEIIEMDTYSVTLDEAIEDPGFVVDQSLMLINTSYTIPEGFEWDIEEYKSTTVYMNTCMLDAYASLSAAVREQTGNKLYVSSDLRSREEQEVLWREDPTTATLPGASEHESGLCLDVYVARYSGDGFLKSRSGRFVNSHAHEYGFIIRYPSYGEDSTGIRFEPWHIRYVGRPVADYIYNNSLTLEEFILSLEPNTLYRCGEYIFSRQSDKDSLNIPEGAISVTISPDNTGHYVYVAKIA